MIERFSPAFVGLAILLVSACAPNVSPNTYSVGSVGQVNRAVQGVIISARLVQISGTSALGATAGAAGGAVGGSAIGGSTRGNIAGAIGGAVVGGLIGAAIEEGATRQPGMEYVVKAENGALLTITQGTDPAFAVGDKVIVLYGTRSRIIPDTSGTNTPGTTNSTGAATSGATAAPSGESSAK